MPKTLAAHNGLQKACVQVCVFLIGTMQKLAVQTHVFNQWPPVYTSLHQASVYLLSETHKNSGGVKFYTSGLKRFTPGKCVFPKGNYKIRWCKRLIPFSTLKFLKGEHPGLRFYTDSPGSPLYWGPAWQTDNTHSTTRPCTIKRRWIVHKTL